MNSGNTQKVRDEVDQHVIAGVLTSSLKDMHIPIMFEVYNDVLNTEITEDSRLCIAAIRNWIVKLSSPKFEIIKQLFALLNSLSSSRFGGIADSNPTQLAFNLAPFICRPYNSAYMSIRHMEDLLKIRPVIAFIIENFNEIMTKDLRPRPPVVVASSKLYPDNYNDLPSPIRNQIQKNSDPVKPFVSYPFPPNIQIPFVDDDKNNSQSSINNDNDVQHVSRNVNFQSWEWKMLETLTVARLDGILKESSMRNSRNESISNSNLSSNSGNVVTKKIRYETKKLDQNNNDVDIEKLRIDSDHRSMENIDYSNNNGNNHGMYGNRFEQKVKRESRGIARRRMVSECKSLRSKISQFEEEWHRDNNRGPIKNSDRGPMQAIYTKYREIKKAIRDHAATDIQRYIRGYLTRLTKKRNRKESGKNNDLSIASIVNITNISRPLYVPMSLSESKLSDINPHPAIQVDNFSSIPTEIYSRYRELLGEKRELKRKLKRFDEDFEAQHGRTPNRSDKEVMRPLYQKYHDVKSQLEDLRAKIEASHGPLPEEFIEGGNISVAPFQSNNAQSDPKPTDERDSSFFDREISDSKSSINMSDGIRLSGIVRGNPLDLESLQTEKRDLHAYLKAYERDFTRTHGRPVMKHEDIAAVAPEYERYKELKGILSLK